MQRAKAYSFPIGCAVFGAAALAVCVAGMRSTAAVEALRRRAGVGDQIARLMRDPKNAELVAAEVRSNELFRREYAETMRCARGINLREPLLAGVFPRPTRIAQRFEFVERYRRALARLRVRLTARDVPDEAEIRWLAEDVDRPESTAEQVTGLAYVSVARSIRCYVGATSFQASPLLDEAAAPTAERMWYAQVELWIQQDVVDAVAALNEQAAGEIADGRANVQDMPVKRIERFAVLGYQTQRGLLRFPRRAGEGPTLAQDVRPTVSGRVCDGQFDVVRFRFAAVIDQRDLLQLVDAISRRNFFQCVDAEFVAVTPQTTPVGCLYGTEPAVRAELEFEAYFSRAVYDPLMPVGVRRLLRDDEG